jgi:hypothetical protein
MKPSKERRRIFLDGPRVVVFGFFTGGSAREVAADGAGVEGQGASVPEALVSIVCSSMIFLTIVRDGFGCLSWAPSLSSLAVHKLVVRALIREKWHKLQFALFRVIAGSFLGKFSLQPLDVQYCDHCRLYLGRDRTAFMHRYINC